VNEVNGGDNVFVRYVYVCVCAAETVTQTNLKRALNANSYKTVKDTDLKFDTRVPRRT